MPPFLLMSSITAWKSPCCCAGDGTPTKPLPAAPARLTRAMARWISVGVTPWSVALSSPQPDAAPPPDAAVAGAGPDAAVAAAGPAEGGPDVTEPDGAE